MTARFRENQNSSLIPELRNQGILPICETFDRAAFDVLLGEPGCASIRTYLGMDPDLKIRLITVAVNDQDEDILPVSTKALAKNEGDGDGDGETGIVEEGHRCPDFCPPASGINGG